ncbi:hypothetical protein, partial [Roseomonas mucosa]
MTGVDLQALAELERKVLWLATWTIHHANHLRPNTDGLKVGGHQASSASMATILTTLYLAVLRPEDRVVVTNPALKKVSCCLCGVADGRGLEEGA